MAYLQVNIQRGSSPLTEITYIKAVNQIRSRIKHDDSKGVHVYSFNVHPEQLQLAYNLLDKQEQRRAMRVTYSDEFNFIVRYMSSRAHEKAQLSWGYLLFFRLAQLTPQPFDLPPGCSGLGGTTIHLGPRQKQADNGVCPDPSDLPSVVLEVGGSESLTQLKIDASLWIEHLPEVQLVILVSINRPIPPLSNPKLTIQLWRGFVNPRPLRSAAAHPRVAQVVWEADWTNTATPLYILLSDIFRGQVPPAYGEHDRVYLDTVRWREDIIQAL